MFKPIFKWECGRTGCDRVWGTYGELPRGWKLVGDKLVCNRCLSGIRYRELKRRRARQAIISSE